MEIEDKTESFPFCDEETAKIVRRDWWLYLIISYSVLLSLIFLSISMGNGYIAQALVVLLVMAAVLFGHLLVGDYYSDKVFAHRIDDSRLVLKMFLRETNNLFSYPVPIKFEDIEEVEVLESGSLEENNHVKEGETWTSFTHPSTFLRLRTKNGKIYRFSVRDLDTFIGALTKRGVVCRGFSPDLSSPEEDRKEDADEEGRKKDHEQGE